jgi:hypothetical protein
MAAYDPRARAETLMPGGSSLLLSDDNQPCLDGEEGGFGAVTYLEF